MGQGAEAGGVGRGQKCEVWSSGRCHVWRFCALVSPSHPPSSEMSSRGRFSARGEGERHGHGCRLLRR
eukprot:scaffold2668_cov115-Isochrysis_galbana.AAC.18